MSPYLFGVAAQRALDQVKNPVPSKNPNRSPYLSMIDPDIGRMVAKARLYAIETQLTSNGVILSDFMIAVSPKLTIVAWKVSMYMARQAIPVTAHPSDLDLEASFSGRSHEGVGILSIICMSCALWNC